jgi:alpha-tubulin suppressor-like RCC1 family protein
VQTTVLVGGTAPIQLVLHPSTQSTGGSATFSLPAVAIAAGPRTSYAVLTDGTVRAWGANESGELGTTTPAGSLMPVTVPGVTNAVQIAAGAGYACVLRTDTSVMCWGLNNNTFLTPTATVGTVSPPVLSPGLFATQINASGGETAVIGAGATPAIGLISAAAAAGDTTTGMQWSPSGAPSNAISVAAGAAGNLCWVSREGTAYCNWSNGGLAGAAAAIGGYASAVGQVFQGVEDGTNNFACAVGAVTGGVSCWGANTYGELGTGTASTTATVNATSVQVGSGFYHVTTMALSRGTIAGAHACAITGGTVYCTGSNFSGQLGIGITNAVTTFFPVDLLASNMVAVAAGQAHTCSLDAEGFVRCWGDNDDGELGDGTDVTRFAPVAVQAW